MFLINASTQGKLNVDMYKCVSNFRYRNRNFLKLLIIYVVSKVETQFAQIGKMFSLSVVWSMCLPSVLTIYDSILCRFPSRAQMMLNLLLDRRQLHNINPFCIFHLCDLKRVWDMTTFVLMCPLLNNIEDYNHVQTIQKF